MSIIPRKIIEEYRNNVSSLHKKDGPALVYSNGDKEWYENGKFHRENGPAIEWQTGKGWWQNGKRHRLDGPAVEWADGKKGYWINDIRYTEESYKLKIKEMDLPTDIAPTGTKYWKNKNGDYHRENGPAIEFISGTKHWYKNGQLHRLDGPAVEYINGDKTWYIEGIVLHSEEKFKAKIKEMDLPTEISPTTGTKYWLNEKNQLHRINDPAIEFVSGTKEWYINGQRHRLDGPAIKNVRDNMFEWWINGVSYSEEEYKAKIKQMCLSDRPWDNISNLELPKPSPTARTIKNIKKSHYRFLTKNLIKSSKSAILLSIKHYLKSNDKDSKLFFFEEILKTKFGESLVAAILAAALESSSDPRLDKIKDELQQESIALAEEVLFDTLFSKDKKLILPVEEKELIEEEIKVEIKQERT